MKISPSVWTASLMIAGNPAVDFVNTLSDAETDPVDRLGDAEALAKWSAVAGLADETALERMSKEIRRDAGAAGRLYARASDLRGALRRIFLSAEEHRAASKDDLREVDLWLKRGAETTALTRLNGHYGRVFTDNASALERPLIDIARAAESLLTNGDLDRLHQCAAHGCGWMFVDTSRNGKRRWCSMATCGTASKVKTFRSRKKKTGTEVKSR